MVVSGGGMPEGVGGCVGLYVGSKSCSHVVVVVVLRVVVVVVSSVG